MKKTAIIIINYNSALETLKYVNEIKDYQIINKIIIVDNASTDDSLNVLKQIQNAKIKVVRADENLGYAKGNNFGVQNLEEKYDYIIISNPDISVEEKTIIKCINQLENNEKLAIVAPRIFINKKPDKRSAWKQRTFWEDVINSVGILQILFFPVHKKSQYSKKEFAKDITEVDCVSGSFFIIKYEVFKQVNFFDPNTFLYYEEDILCKKVKELGYTICSVNTEKCIHYKSKTIDKVLNLFTKKDVFNKSRKYYHYKYNNIAKWKLVIFDILNFFRKCEILVEICIKKLCKLVLKR